MTSVYIVVDLECISGMTSGAMIRTGSSEWATRGRHLATAEVNAVVEGAMAAGAERIVVRDSHDSGENLVREDLHPIAELIAGSTNVTPYLPGLDASFDALYLIGFHARMGTRFAHFDHTVTTAAISEARLNGIAVGEIGLHAAYAGYQGVPVALVTGDAAGVAEAHELFGAIEAVAVKEGYGRFAAKVPAAETTRPLVRVAAERALKRGGRVWHVGTPVEAALDFLRTAEADMAEMVPGAVRAGPRTVSYRHDDPAMTFKAIEAMIKLGGIAANKWASGLYTSGDRVT